MGVDDEPTDGDAAFTGLRPLAADGQFSRVALGTMTFGAQVDAADAARMVDGCLAAGVTTFDTAESYTGGRSEEILGRIVRPIRDQVVLCSKVGGGAASTGALGRTALLASAAESLRRLGTDHLDVYYLHRPDRGTPIAETLEALGVLLDDGRIRGVGLSNFSSWQVLEISQLAQAMGQPKIAVTQPIYNLLVRRIESEYAELTRQLDIPNLVYNPLAGGLLTGKHDSVAATPTEGRFTNKRYVRRYWKPEVFAAVERLSAAAEADGVTLAQLALRWVMAQPVVGGVLLGASSPAQLAENLEAVTGPAPSPEVSAICDEVWAVLHGAAPDYNR
jgi:aryl-alcohol dehydrogenase-like predicted oxidoreductase